MKAAQPDATIERMETDADGATYEAHITKADGTRATVLLDANFTVTETQDRARAVPAAGAMAARMMGTGRRRHGWLHLQRLTLQRALGRRSRRDVPSAQRGASSAAPETAARPSSGAVPNELSRGHSLPSGSADRVHSKRPTA